MSPESTKDIAVLSLLTDLQKLLEADVDLAERVRSKLELLPTGRTLNKMLLSKRAKQSYYSERYALELLPTLDNMIATHEPCQFLLSEHPNVTVRTLYLKIYQPWQWLIDFHPEKEKYKQLKKETITVQRPNHSVRILFETSLVTLQPKSIDPTLDSLSKLHNKITEFLAMPIITDVMFDERKLSLSPTQMAEVKDSIAGVPNLVPIIEPSRVRIMRKFVEIK